MIEKLLEAFFRHAALIVLPIIVIPLDVAAWVLSTPPQYEASAGMWVEPATYLSYSTDDINRYLPPSQNQRSRLVELMQTKTFLLEVAGKTALAPVSDAADGDERLKQLFARDFEVFAGGDHLLNLRFRSEDRAVAIEVLDAMVTAFKARAAADRYGQAQVAITFYQSRLAKAEGELFTARNALAKYLAEHPTTVPTAGVDVARFDPQLAEVQRRLDISQRAADAERSSLERAELDVAAGIQGFAFGFQIVDPVQASASPSRQIRKVLVYPIVALILGLVLSASLLLLFALSDHSIRSLADLAPDSVILGVLPHLQAQGVARRTGPDRTRRAIGFTAGAVIAVNGKRERRAS